MPDPVPRKPIGAGAHQGGQVPGASRLQLGRDQEEIKLHQNKIFRLALILCLLILGCSPVSRNGSETPASTLQTGTSEALCAKNSPEPIGSSELNPPVSQYKHKPVPQYDYSLLDIDIAFVVDTSATMANEIAQIQADLSSLVGQIKETTSTYRIAVVSYRDFSQRTGYSSDYPFRVDQTFTDDPDLIQAAIDSLSAQGGGDCPETVFSGIQAAIELPWRLAVTRVVIVIGDAPVLSPEPISNLTVSQIVRNSIARNVVQVIGVDLGYLNDNGTLGQIAAATGGSVIPVTSDLTNTLLEILDRAANQPYAWIGQAYSGKIGEPVQFDTSGSYGSITLYEWDFDGDGIFDLETTETTATHIYNAAFNDFVVVRMTNPDGIALTSARTVVNRQGYAPQGDWWDVLEWLLK